MVESYSVMDTREISLFRYHVTYSNNINVWDCGPDCFTGWIFKRCPIQDSTVEGHQAEVTPLSFSSRLFLAQMACVCYGLWLQRLHVFLDLAASHCEDINLLSRQPADADVQLWGCKVHRYCWVGGLAGDTCTLNSAVPGRRHMPTLLPAGPDKTWLLLSHL